MGWIKLHRQLLDWEWFSDKNVLAVFLYLLLTANHKDGFWQGHAVGAGQRITSHKKIATATNLSIQEVRTALKKLKKSGEIEVLATHQFLLVSLVKWAFFQGQDYESNTPSNTLATDLQHTTNTPSTTNKNEKNKKNDENENNPFRGGRGGSLYTVREPPAETEPASYPDTLPTAIVEALGTWEQYLVEIHRPLTPTARQELYRTLQREIIAHGEDSVAHVIRASVANQYKGIAFNMLKAPAQPANQSKFASYGGSGYTDAEFEEMEAYSMRLMQQQANSS